MRSPWKTQFVASLQAAIGTAGGTGESRIQGVEMESDGTPWRLLVVDPITLEVGGGYCFGLEALDSRLGGVQGLEGFRCRLSGTR